MGNVAWKRCQAFRRPFTGAYIFYAKQHIFFKYLSLLLVPYRAVEYVRQTSVLVFRRCSKNDNMEQPDNTVMLLLSVIEYILIIDMKSTPVKSLISPLINFSTEKTSEDIF